MNRTLTKVRLLEGVRKQVFFDVVVVDVGVCSVCVDGSEKKNNEK